jgi:hypothetical protein
MVGTWRASSLRRREQEAKLGPRTKDPDVVPNFFQKRFPPHRGEGVPPTADSETPAGSGLRAATGTSNFRRNSVI